MYHLSVRQMTLLRQKIETASPCALARRAQNIGHQIAAQSKPGEVLRVLVVLWDHFRKQQRRADKRGKTHGAVARYIGVECRACQIPKRASLRPRGRHNPFELFLPIKALHLSFVADERFHDSRQRRRQERL